VKSEGDEISFFSLFFDFDFDPAYPSGRDVINKCADDTAYKTQNNINDRHYYTKDETETSAFRGGEDRDKKKWNEDNGKQGIYGRKQLA
jgi:hypothetical protein